MRRDDGGFTLIEVLVAILIIGTMLLVLLGVSSGALAVQETARRQQVAAGIANEVMERIRSLGYSDIEAGIGSGAIALDSHVISCADGYRLLKCGRSSGLGELVMYTSAAAPVIPCPTAVAVGSLPAVSASTVAPLRPSNCTAYLLNGVEYRAYAYVTSTVAKTVSKKDAPYRITVVVDWSDHGQKRSTTLQSMAWAPLGCTGALTKDLVGGPCGLGRSTSYGFSRGASLEIAFCGTPPGCNGSSPAIEVRLGSIGLTWTEDSGDIQVTSALTPSEVITVSGAARTTVPLQTPVGAAAADSLVADNIDSTVTIEKAGPQYPGRGATGSPIARSASFSCTTCSGALYGTIWELRAYVLVPAVGSCLVTPLACAALEANVGEGGLCEAEAVAAPCVAAAASFAEIEVSLCRATPLDNCSGYVIGRIGGGLASGALTDQGNSLSSLGAYARLGYLGTVGSNDWIAAGTYDAVASNAVLKKVEVQESSLYVGAAAASAPCIGLSSATFSTLAATASAQPCFFTSPLNGNAPRSRVLQLPGLSTTASTLSGKWFYGEYDGSPECASRINSNGTIFDTSTATGGGIATKFTSCPQLAPALVVALRFPGISASESSTPATAKWYSW